MSLGEHPSIQLDRGDLVILSSRAIPGNERVLGNVIDHLVRRGCRVLAASAADPSWCTPPATPARESSG